MNWMLVSLFCITGIAAHVIIGLCSNYGRRCAVKECDVKHKKLLDIVSLVAQILTVLSIFGVALWIISAITEDTHKREMNDLKWLLWSKRDLERQLVDLSSLDLGYESYETKWADIEARLAKTKSRCDLLCKKNYLF